MVENKPGRGSDQFPLRLPDGMRDRIKQESENSGRSMNAEIVARLERSLQSPFRDITGETLESAVWRLEFTANAFDDLFSQIRNDMLIALGMAPNHFNRIKAAIEAFGNDQNVQTGPAIQLILEKWLTDNGYFPK
ncbi:Arc family DNA-binding protein [Agrobacterium vitis]|uniref:Arc family DNA-binding protein n=1 Tax=Agrobacterium vitis TaxID=373 RepID=UPI001571B73D|nr:Arc family DNA-binding protein [Agrobacterium vitis]NSY12471.1 Arc family DNA-binding protein [Agrobacterium vitis]